MRVVEVESRCRSIEEIRRYDDDKESSPQISDSSRA
jgi:hypothetical protein